MSLFAKAVEKTKSAAKTTKPSKNTTWTVGSSEEDLAVGKAVSTLVKFNADKKAIDAKMALATTVVKNYAKGRHVNDFAELGVPPETPLKVQNKDGESVSLVVQDRSSQYAVKPEQMAVMEQLLGPDAAANLTYSETSIGLDRTILAIPGVSKAIEKALEESIMFMIKVGTLTEEQAGELVVAKQKVSFKPGTVERAAMIAGQDSTRIGSFLDAMGSCCVRYVKI